ncbi:MAG: pyrimidine dimer DNA glycosylase/endonuclease V [Archaeoglobaceae archaeon]|nr:pyrimidine dimer DNA glycosylase/endonuclease V [Archaeoglobaceae archaeon]
MRLWSLHPKLLDSKGLVAVWREALLARKVLEGKTKGYRNHPQLERFKKFKEPIKAINSYIYFVFVEGKKRGYELKREKIYPMHILKKIIPVTVKQIEFEFSHLISKLEKRDIKHLRKISKSILDVNPVFYVVEGEIEPWEKISIK